VAGHRLQRVGAGPERLGGALKAGVEELAAERVLGRVGDRVQDPVEASPARLELPRDRGEVGLAVDVELEDVGGLGQPLRGALGEPPRATEAGEHHLGAGQLRLARDREGDAAAGDHPGDQQALAVEHQRSTRPATSGEASASGA
jgi:hypothetical protein